MTDMGCGIAAENIERVFCKYERPTVKKGSDLHPCGDAKHKPGSGLGLYLVKSLTEMLGGSAEVASEPGRGSTFIAHIPVNEGEGEHGEDSGR